MATKGGKIGAAGFALYDVKVRLSGSMLNEVRKEGVTAPEAMVYQSIHGPDSLVEVKPAKGELKTLDSTDRDERQRLAQIFEISPDKNGFITKVFGAPTIPLPREFPEDFAVDHAVEIGASVPDDLATAVLQS